MRLFAALLPPTAALDEIEAAVAPYQDTPRLRWTVRADWHITLAFYGDVPEPTRHLADVAATHPPRALTLTGAGAFNDRHLWLGVQGNLTALATACAITLETRPYRPHLTLAHNRGRDSLQPFTNALAPYQGTPWTATELHLMRSAHGYTSIASWPLTGPEDNTINDRAN